MAAGRFITLEGGEGAGKSTQAALLGDALRAEGLSVVTTREPGGAPAAERIRELLIEGEGWDPLTEALLHFAARREHLREVVLPALDSGAWVVSDRFADSTTAYQGYGLGVDREIIDELYHRVAGDFRPDLTLIFDLPVETGLARARGRGESDRYERMGLDFHRRLRDGFLEICRAEPERCMLIDATADPETVAASVWAAVRERLMP